MGLSTRRNLAMSFVAPAGTPHAGWNVGDFAVRLRVQMTPALRWEQCIRQPFAAVATGRTNAAGTPDQRPLAELLRAFQ